jgi:single-strand DNA-binding protein
MNKIILIGNLTSAPELKGTQTGNKVCSFGLAVNDRRGGEQNTQFFRVSAWDRMGESCMTYLTKGKKVFVSGPLTVRMYSKSDGSTGVSLEVTANDVEFLSPRDDSAGYAPTPSYAAPTPPQPSEPMPVETDELPF